MFICLPILVYESTNLPTYTLLWYLVTNLTICLFACPHVHMCPNIYLSTYPHVYLPTSLPVNWFTSLSVYLPIVLPVYLSTWFNFYFSTCIPVRLFVYLITTICIWLNNNDLTNKYQYFKFFWHLQNRWNHLRKNDKLRHVF